MESSVYERLDLNESWDSSTWDDRVSLRETRHQQDTAPLSSSDPLSSDSAVPLSSDQMMDSTRQNVAVLSLLLSVSLLGNLLAFSVIMFRKTRYYLLAIFVIKIFVHCCKPGSATVSSPS